MLQSSDDIVEAQTRRGANDVSLFFLSPPIIYLYVYGCIFKWIENLRIQHL